MSRLEVASPQSSFPLLQSVSGSKILHLFLNLADCPQLVIFGYASKLLSPQWNVSNKILTTPLLAYQRVRLSIYLFPIPRLTLISFVRIIPQAISVRYGLGIGASCAPLVIALMYIMGAYTLSVLSRTTTAKNTS